MLEKTVLSAIIICLLLQLHLQFVQKINWDEFFFLSKVYDYQQGDLNHALQSFYVHFFGWLPVLGANEILQIEIARVVMWFLEIGTLVFIFTTSRVFVSRIGAMLAALAWISSGFIFIHGTGFRADPIVAFLMMFCVHTLACSALRYRNLVGIVLAAAMAALVTVKVIFFAPALIGLAVWRLFSTRQPGRLLYHFMLTAVASFILFGGLFALQLFLLPASSLVGSQGMMASAGKVTILSHKIFPRSNIIIGGFFTALPQSLLLIFGLVLTVTASVTRPSERKRAFVLFSLFAPLLSLIFYRNAFPYFFPFIFAPAMVFVGVAADKLSEYSDGRSITQWAMTILIVVSGTTQYASRLPEVQSTQQEIISVVHKMFNEPVNYIDRCAMISSFPKAGYFMSSWGVSGYLQRGVPVMQSLLDNQIIPLLILNSPVLERAVMDNVKGSTTLLPQDSSALRENFIPHWGRIWVAGKRLDLDSRGASFQIDIPGKYTVEATVEIEIDGKSVAPGSVEFLARGEHHVTSQMKTQLILRWGDNLFQPDTPASNLPLFNSF